MPVATTTQAGREVLTPAAEKILSDRERKRAEASRAAAALNDRPDTTTPLVGHAPLETLPDPPTAPKVEKTARRFSLQTTIEHRGRAITIVAEGLTLDEFCDLMDARQYRAPAPLQLAAPVATADDLPDGYKLCLKHRAPMRPRNKQNDHWHSHNVGTAENPLWCKGYRGSDSPGYEVD